MEQFISTKPTLQDRIVIKEGLHDLKACVALMSSGTMSFAFSLAGIPGVIAYKAHPITYLIGKLLVKVPYLGMANLLLSKEPPYKEFIQSEANRLSLSSSIEKLLGNEESGEEFRNASLKLRSLLQGAQELDAVDWLADELAKA